MGKWKEVKLSEVYDVRDGTHDSPKYVQEGYPLVTSKNLKGNSVDLSNVKYISQDDYDAINKRSKVDIGDVLFAMIGTIGNPILIEEDPNYAIKNVALFKKKDLNQDSKFLTYYLGSERILDKMISEAKGATQKFVGLTYLRNFKIPLPPLQEQQRIVAKLDGLFAKIDQAISLLDANLQHTQALMGSVLDEEFGKLDCEKKSLKELVLKTKTANPKKDFPEDEFTYIDISSVNKELNQIEEPKILFGKDAPSRARKVIQKEDIVFATTRPNLKNIAIVFETFNNPIASTGFCVLRVDKEILNNEYLFYFLISDLVQEYIQPFIRGAQYPAISDKDLLSLKIPFLSIKEQEVKVARIKNTFKVSKNLIKTQTQKLNHLKALKSSLLDQAFKGEL